MLILFMKPVFDDIHHLNIDEANQIRLGIVI